MRLSRPVSSSLRHRLQLSIAEAAAAPAVVGHCRVGQRSPQDQHAPATACTSHDIAQVLDLDGVAV